MKSELRTLEKAYGRVSQNLQALHLFHGSADVLGVLERHLAPQPTAMNHSAFYQRLLENILPELSENALLNKNKVDLKIIDPSAPYACSWMRSNSVAIRCLFEKVEKSVTKRVFLLLHDPSHPKQKISRYSIGNVDLFLVGEDLIGKKTHFEVEAKQTIEFNTLDTKRWLQVAMLLDGGQRLNLSEIFGRRTCFSGRIGTQSPCEQYYHQLSRYFKGCPNGFLIAKPPLDFFLVVHQSPFKSAIVSSGELRVSRGGCIGILVYTTELVGKTGVELGGHALGLLERKGIDRQNQYSHLIMADVKKSGNITSNWIDKFGRGIIIASARERIYKNPIEKKSLEVDLQCQAMSCTEYKRIFPLLQMSVFLGTFIKDRQHLTEDIAIKGIQAFKKLYGKIDRDSRSLLLNSVYFEMIKDYILLFQNDSESIKLRSKNSFNMSMQYHIFFELLPELKKNWDTTQFNPPLERVEAVLEKKGFFHDPKQRMVFYKFFLERLTGYINLTLLEGNLLLAKPKEVNNFHDLSQKAPNLANILYYYFMKSHFQNGKFYHKFSEAMRLEYERFYQERNIQVVVKCGVARTEEIGLTESAKVNFFDFKIETKNDEVRLIPIAPIPFLKIQGVSKTNGFTKRPEAKKKR